MACNPDSGPVLEQQAKLPRGGATFKKDNLRGGDFPARRHYEAEGRANEDPDLPRPAPTVPLPAASQSEGDLLTEKVRYVRDSKHFSFRVLFNAKALRRTIIQSSRVHSGQKYPNAMQVYMHGVPQTCRSNCSNLEGLLRGLFLACAFPLLPRTSAV